MSEAFEYSSQDHNTCSRQALSLHLPVFFLQFVTISDGGNAAESASEEQYSIFYALYPSVLYELYLQIQFICIFVDKDSFLYLDF